MLRRLSVSVTESFSCEHAVGVFHPPRTIYLRTIAETLKTALHEIIPKPVDVRVQRWDDENMVDHLIVRPDSLAELRETLTDGSLVTATDTVYYFPKDRIDTNAENRAKLSNEAAFAAWRAEWSKRPPPRLWIYPSADSPGRRRHGL